MTLNIVVAKNYIPVIVLENEYRFYRTDDAIVGFESGLETVIKRIEHLESDAFKNKTISEQVDEAKPVMGEAFEFLFKGQDSFNRIYDEVQSITTVVDIYEQILMGLLEELESEDKRLNNKRLEKYLKNKNRRT